ncbi:hypothetical protein ID866_6352 [Astraeus odoratus]|nr:hypothetical protein ID866_6352 [Astraeus odoratus]
MRFASLAVAWTVVGGAMALGIGSSSGNGIRALFDASIWRRQSGEVPANCTSTCDPVVSATNAGCPITQCCTNDFITAYYSCFACIGTATNTSDFSIPQAALDDIWVACEEGGYTVDPPPTFPGQTALVTSASAKTTAKATTTTAKVGVPPASTTTTTTSTTSQNATATATTTAITSGSDAIRVTLDHVYGVVVIALASLVLGI